MNLLTKCIKRLTFDDSTLKLINLKYNHSNDSNVTKLVECLLVYPNVVTEIWLHHNQLSDATGVELARYVAISSNLITVSLRYNHIGIETYKALAAAMRVNLSLRYLFLYNSRPKDRIYINTVFINALRLNPCRPLLSAWWVCSCSDKLEKLKTVAKKSTPPSMLEFLLCVHLDVEKIETKKH